MAKRGLTVQQEAFAQAVVNHGMNHTEAYKHAYNVGATVAQKTINEGGSRTANHPKVKARIDELNAKLGVKLEKRTLWSREQSVAALKKAFVDGNPAVKVSAIRELNAMHGYNAAIRIQDIDNEEII
jgi:hypothetical protein